jgi:CubicO group peptidase (beta-lactamase class C family)
VRGSQACCSAIKSARELARVGYLVLRGGRWRGPTGERILFNKKEVKALFGPARAAARARFAPTPNSPFPIEPDAPSRYGLLWWTNANGRGLGPAVPRDAIYAHGYRETLLVVVPSLDLLVVRFGRAPAVMPTFASELVRRVVAAIV